MTDVTIFQAKKIITMCPDLPFATHVAVQGGRIQRVGTAEDFTGNSENRINRQFADKILMPGFVEGHAHMDAGKIWQMIYVGNFHRIDPQGKAWPPLADLPAILERLRTSLTHNADDVLCGWGFDPLLTNAAMTRHDLDQLSDRQPILVWHASGHIISANTPALKRAGMFPPKVSHPGVPLGEDGLPIGDLRGIEIMVPAAKALGVLDRLMGSDGSAAKPFSRMAVRAGITTAADLANSLSDKIIDELLAITAGDDFPLRLVPALLAPQMTPDQMVERASSLRPRSTDRLRLGLIKMIADGSIQGFTARLRTPGYYNQSPPGLWYTAPERLLAVYRAALGANIQVHTHTNGDEASDMALDCLEQALAQHPSGDHRFTLQHAQLTDAGHFARMKRMGACVNLFSNHIYYWGESHVAHTVGPDRAACMNAAKSALAASVPLAIHSDEPVTPMAPLFTAWCSVNRLTSAGRVLGPDERISVQDALYAITMGAAYTLKLEHEIGSIEIGKCADFAVLEDDPLSIDPINLRDIKVWGTVQAGRVFEAAKI
jgi:predicted amidohydrolase YtcJ